MLILKERTVVLGFIFLCLPFFDMVNGFLVVRGFLPEGGLASPSQLGRLLATALLAYVAVKNKLSAMWVFVFVLCSLLEFVAAIRSGNFFGVVYGVMTAYRLAFFSLLFTVLLFFTHQDIRGVGRFLKCNLLFIAMSIVFASVSGLGNSTYGWGFGTKGFFASGNGLGVYLGVAALTLLLMKHYGLYRDVSVLSLVIACMGMFSIGSKTAIVLALLTLFMLAWLSRFRTLLFSLLALALLYLSPYILNVTSVAFDVIIIRYKNSDSVLEYLTSARLEYVTHAFSVIESQGVGVWRWLFGGGSLLSFQNPYAQIGFDTLETDPFDILFMYGMFGLSVYVMLCVYGMTLYRGCRYFLLGWLLMVLHSVFAGHVIFNGMSVTMMALLLAIGSALRGGRISQKSESDVRKV